MAVEVSVFSGIGPLVRGLSYYLTEPYLAVATTCNSQFGNLVGKDKYQARHRRIISRFRDDDAVIAARCQNIFARPAEQLPVLQARHKKYTEQKNSIQN